MWTSPGSDVIYGRGIEGQRRLDGTAMTYRKASSTAHELTRPALKRLHWLHASRTVSIDRESGFYEF